MFEKAKERLVKKLGGYTDSEYGDLNEKYKRQKAMNDIGIQWPIIKNSATRRIEKYIAVYEVHKPFPLGGRAEEQIKQILAHQLTDKILEKTTLEKEFIPYEGKTVYQMEVLIAEEEK